MELNSIDFISELDRVFRLNKLDKYLTPQISQGFFALTERMLS